MLIELPDGDWLDPQAVRGITLLDDLQHGPRVRIDLAGAIQLKMVEFDNPDAARNWRSEFACRCNAATSMAEVLARPGRA